MHVYQTETKWRDAGPRYVYQTETKWRDAGPRYVYQTETFLHINLYFAF